jgi:hypothetical protein
MRLVDKARTVSASMTPRVRTMFGLGARLLTRAGQKPAATPTALLHRNRNHFCSLAYANVGTKATLCVCAQKWADAECSCPFPDICTSPHRRSAGSARSIRRSHRRANMRNIVDQNWQRLRQRLKDFWNTLIGEKRAPGGAAWGR